jgi:hypothetical protein
MVVAAMSFDSGGEELKKPLPPRQPTPEENHSRVIPFKPSPWNKFSPCFVFVKKEGAEAIDGRMQVPRNGVL